MEDKNQDIENRLELKSDELEDILGKPPSRIIRWGISLMFVIIAVILVGSWFFKYPDIIPAPVEVTSENPPVYLAAREGGKLEKVFISDNQYVDSGDYILIIENPANYNHVITLRKRLDAWNEVIKTMDSLAITMIKDSIDHDLRLGDIQNEYAGFVSSVSNYCHYITMDYSKKKVSSLEDELFMHNFYYDRLYQQQKILEQDLDLTRKDYMRYQDLYDSLVVAESQMEDSQSSYLQKELSLEESKTELANTKIQISKIKQNILEHQLQDEKNHKVLELDMQEKFKNLKSKITLWEKSYILQAPISGVASFNKYWNENQIVEKGERVLAIVSDIESLIIGKVRLNSRNAGKVKTGQQVNIKLNSYPYMEYGMVRGTIEKISIVPSVADFYLVEVSFPNGLETNYGIQLEFSQKMNGIAEIITEELPLLIRIINPVKSLLKNKSVRKIPDQM